MKPKPFPETVEHKSCLATIYRHRNRQSVRYETRYYDVDGSLQRVTFLHYGSVKKFAETVVRSLAENRESYVALRGREAYEYKSAQEQLAPTGLSLLEATTMFSNNFRLLAGQATLTEAVKYFIENRPQRSPTLRFARWLISYWPSKRRKVMLAGFICATSGCG